ncbi:Uncharacterised protein [Mycobacteroides abscessus subsp. abscessus]|nr:Uncharacterised protein [Mycobacteroides abscessus subsp. abscessus]
MPSCASGDTNRRAEVSVNSTARASKSARIGAVVSRFDSASPCGEPSAMSSTNEVTAASTASALSTDWVTKPISAATRASNFSPVTK